jgi:hypothetical protein
MSDESSPLPTRPMSRSARALIDSMVSLSATLGPVHPDPFRESQQQRRSDRDQYYAGQAIAQGLDPDEARRRMESSGLPDEIEKLAQADPIVANWRHVYMNGDCTREECLTGMVLTLAEANRLLSEAHLKLLQERPDGR